MNLQYQLSNAAWVDLSPEREAEFFDRVIAMEARIAEVSPAYLKRAPLATHDEGRAALAAGAKLRLGTDWYDNIRQEPAPRPVRKHDLVRCACGHECERILVMSASLGSSCPDCYDRLSG